MSTETDRAYLAGMIDGEGTITAGFTLTKKGIPGLRYRVMVSNTNREMLEWIQSRFGGNINRSTRPRSPKHKQVYTLYWDEWRGVPLLEEVLPYLVIKRRHAEIYIALHELVIPRGGGARLRGVPPENQAQRIPLITEIAALNHRGVPLN